ncbi:hypothetical protein PMAYCL1PPCAC_05633, partial [Pristionchus mayeri]
DDSDIPRRVIVMINLTLLVFEVCLVFIACKQERAVLITPVLVYTVVNMLAAVIFIVLYTITLFTITSDRG